jgi:shikimate kinase
MLDTRLIIVEGVMGSGKSTTGHAITRRLRANLYLVDNVILDRVHKMYRIEQFGGKLLSINRNLLLPC